LSEEKPDSRDEKARDKDRREAERAEAAGQETPTIVAVLLAVAAVIAELERRRRVLRIDEAGDLDDAPRPA
jgi:hypothetical protein